MKLGRNRRKGQAIVEYIIIIVIVAVAALTVMGLFSDRIRTIIAGVASTYKRRTAGRRQQLRRHSEEHGQGRYRHQRRLTHPLFPFFPFRLNSFDPVFSVLSGTEETFCGFPLS